MPCHVVRAAHHLYLNFSCKCERNCWCVLGLFISSSPYPSNIATFEHDRTCASFVEVILWCEEAVKWYTRFLQERARGRFRVPHASPNVFVYVPIRGNRSLTHIAVLYARKYTVWGNEGCLPGTACPWDWTEPWRR